MLEHVARFVVKHRLLVVAAWIGLLAFGLFATTRVSNRWLEQFSIPGYSAYEGNQRVLKTFGNGAQAPNVAVFQSSGDVTKTAGLKTALGRFEREHPTMRVSSYFNTGSRAYVSRDGHTTFAEFYPPGQEGFSAEDDLGLVRGAMSDAVPPGVTVHVTGIDALYNSESSSSGGPSVLTETLIGGLGALVILLFVFGTLPAVAIPLAIAATAILTTFSLIWALTYLTSVSLIVQYLVALVGLGVAIDYSLLMIFRFREELAHGEDVETAVVETMRHAGRSVVVSGSTVAIGLLSMVIIPIPVIRSIGIGGMLIPAVSVIAATTLLPALLATLGHRVNSVRVMPRRFVAVTDAESGFWGRWARVVMRRPLPIAIAGAAIVGLLLVPGVQLNPADAQAKTLAGKASDDGVIGFRELTAAGISPASSSPTSSLPRTDPSSERPAARRHSAGRDFRDCGGGRSALVAPGWHVPGGELQLRRRGVEAGPKHHCKPREPRPSLRRSAARGTAPSSPSAASLPSSATSSTRSTGSSRSCWVSSSS